MSETEEKSRENSRLKRRCLSDVVEEHYRAVLLTIRTRRQEVRVVMQIFVQVRLLPNDHVLLGKDRAVKHLTLTENLLQGFVCLELISASGHHIHHLPLAIVSSRSAERAEEKISFIHCVKEFRNGGGFRPTPVIFVLAVREHVAIPEGEVRHEQIPCVGFIIEVRRK